MVTEVLAGQQLKKLGLELIFRVGLEISLKININSKQTNLFPGGRGASPPHPPALTSVNSDITSGPGRLVASELILNEQLKLLGLVAYAEPQARRRASAASRAAKRRGELPKPVA